MSSNAPALPVGRADFLALVEAVAQAVADRLAAPLPQTFDQPGAIAYVGVSRSAWFRLKSAGKVPAPIHIDGTGERWRRKDLDQWIERLKARRKK